MAKQPSLACGFSTSGSIPGRFSTSDANQDGIHQTSLFYFLPSETGVTVKCEDKIPKNIIL